MADWSSPEQLVKLQAFYEADARDPLRFDDDEFLANVEQAFWGTNCWAYVEASFAIIAPACARRPHLARRLIWHPIGAMVAGGLEDPKAVVAQGFAFATKERPYVEPSPEGREWLITRWLELDSVAQEVFVEIFTAEDEASSSP